MAAGMNWQPNAARIHDHLKDTTTRQRLKDRIARAREQVTTSIGEAAKLANVSPEQARYAETIGILSPIRSDQSKGSASHRRYSLGELNRLIVMGDLLKNGFTVGDVARYLNHERSVVDTLVTDLEAADAKARLREAETAYCQRMLIPRLMYLAQCLLLGEVADYAMALVLPVARRDCEASDASIQTAYGTSAPTTRTTIAHVEDLPLVGPSLVGWRLRRRPYCVLYMPAPRMDDEVRYTIRPVDDILRKAGVADVDARPTGAYLLIEREFAHLLDSPLINKPRMAPETMRGDSDKPRPNPRAVAYRLLRRLRLPGNEASNIFGHSFASDGDGMVYNSPELTGGLVSDPLLTAISDLVVELGNAPEAGVSSDRGNWVFSAILIPDDLSLPANRQSLIVTAQSKGSPHIPGVTRLSPGSNAGLSTAAAQSEHMLIRRVMDSSDGAISDAGIEGKPGPALALPFLSMHGRVLGVLYVRAEHATNTVDADNTFTADDQLLLRVISHIIGGIVFNYQGSYLSDYMLSSMMAQPRYVGRFFQEFLSANAFWDDLEQTLDKQLSASSPEPLSLLAIDIDGYTDITNTHGANTARHVVRAVGKRIIQNIKLASIPLPGSARYRARLYFIYGDRFYLLMENMPGDAALTYAQDLRRLLTDDYLIEVTRSNGSRRVPVGITNISVGVSIVVMSYHTGSTGYSDNTAPAIPAVADAQTQPQESVQSMVSTLTDALDAALIQAKQGGPGTILRYDQERHAFVPEKHAPQRESDPEGETPAAATPSASGEAASGSASPAHSDS